jgi:type I restriction enzyme S subunit
LKGLEITELSFNEIWNENQTKRIDPEFFGKEAQLAYSRLKHHRRFADLVKEGYRVIYENTEIINREHGISLNLPFFLQASDLVTPFINAEGMSCVAMSDWERYPKGRIQPGEILIEVKGKAEKVAIVPANFPPNTLVTGTCYKLQVKDDRDKYLLVAFLLCRFGQALKERLKTNLLISFISKDDLYSLPVPDFGNTLKDKISNLFRNAEHFQESSLGCQTLAEQTLLKFLGLENWQPPEPLTYLRRASEAFESQRLDAEYFSPRVQHLLARLNQDGLTIADVAPVRHATFDPVLIGADAFSYIEISGLRGDGTCTAEVVAVDDAPSRANQRVYAGDIITSTVRPIRRLSALIMPEQDQYVCSSGFVVLNPKKIAPEVLLTFLSLPIICELMDLHTSASLYPAISERDILKLPIPKIPAATCDSIIAQVRQAHHSRQQAQALLEKAKRAVEIAIEEGETAALELLS